MATTPGDENADYDQGGSMKSKFPGYGPETVNMHVPLATNNPNNTVNALMIAEYTRDPSYNCMDGQGAGPDGLYNAGPAMPNTPVGAEFRGQAYVSKVPRTTGANPMPEKTQ